MQSEKHVTFEDSKPFQALGGQTPEMRAGPPGENWINRENLKERILSFDQAINGSAGAFRNVKKNERLSTIGSRLQKRGS
jgi:hypothetical protein